MLVAGFTFVRNALKFDYPIVEAITSALPICDLFVVAVGRSEDATLDLVRGIGSPKIRILETVWDDALRAGGRVLAVETDKAFQAIPPEFDWCFYLQADECAHENDLPHIREQMQSHLQNADTEGFAFNYRHFYGSYDFVGASRKWYRREVRVVRNDKRIRSWRDAQGFRWADGRKLRVRLLDAHIHHYGWVKHPAQQQQKQLTFNRLWHSDEAVRAMVGDAEVYAYDGSQPLERFAGTHPAAMQPRIAAMNWHFGTDPTLAQFSWKERASRFFEKNFGWRPGEYRNFLTVRGGQQISF